MNSTDLRSTMTRGASMLAILTLCACGGTQKTEVPVPDDVYDDSFQLSSLTNLLRTPPDEFSVLKKRPLELPDSFEALPVPEPGKRSTRDPNPQADARAALLAGPAAPVAARGAAIAPSATEAAILSSLDPSDPAIRQTLAAEQAEYDSEQDLYILDRIFPRLREVRGELDSEQLDGNAERLRLIESGVTEPRPDGIAPIPLPPVAAAPIAAAPVPVAAAPAPAIQGGPVLAAPEPRPVAPARPSSPTFGVLTPEPTAAPELIYIPE